MKPLMRCLALLMLLTLVALPSQAQDAVAPRAGKYRIFTIPTAKQVPLFLGYFILDGKDGYKAFTQADRPIGEGKYDFQGGNVIWKDGLYKENKWQGRFFATREGKTHEIYLTPSTRATNSTDAK